VRQHNDLAPAALEQQQLFIIHQAYGMIVHLKNVARQHNALAPAALEQQIIILYLSSLWNDSSFKKKCCAEDTIILFIKNVARQHNALAPAAIEQQINFLFSINNFFYFYLFININL